MQKNSRKMFFWGTLIFVIIVILIIQRVEILRYFYQLDLWGKRAFPDTWSDIKASIYIAMPTTIWAWLFRDRVISFYKRLIRKRGYANWEEVTKFQEKQYLRFIYRFISHDFYDRARMHSMPYSHKTRAGLENRFRNYQAFAREIKPQLLEDYTGDLDDFDETTYMMMAGKRTRVLPLIEKYSRVAILGEPGAGKSITLKSYALQHAERNFYKTKPQIPLYIDLKHFSFSYPANTYEDVIDFIKSYVDQYYDETRFIKDRFEKYIQEGRLVILFDSMNEMPPDDYLHRVNILKEFANRIGSKNKVVFSCRSLHYEEFGDQLGEIHWLLIEPLRTTAEIKEFACVYLQREFVDTLISKLSLDAPKLLQACQNPYLLYMTCLVAQKRIMANEPLPKNRSELFRQFVSDAIDEALKRTLEENASTSHQLNTIRHTIQNLCNMAFFMNKNNILGTEIQIKDTTFDLPIELDVLYLASDARLINLTPRGGLIFTHHVMQEYFAARALQMQFEVGEDIYNFVDNPWWEETIVLYSGLLENSNQLINHLLSSAEITSNRLMLTGKCIGNSTIPVENNLLDIFISLAKKELQTTPIRQVKAIQALGHTSRPIATKVICNVLLGRGLDFVHENALRALLSDKSDEAQNAKKHYLWRTMPYWKLFLDKDLRQFFNPWEIGKAALYRFGMILMKFTLLFSLIALIPFIFSLVNPDVSQQTLVATPIPFNLPDIDYHQAPNIPEPSTESNGFFTIFFNLILLAGVATFFSRQEKRMVKFGSGKIKVFSVISSLSLLSIFSILDRSNYIKSPIIFMMVFFLLFLFFFSDIVSNVIRKWLSDEPVDYLYWGLPGLFLVITTIIGVTGLLWLFIAKPPIINNLWFFITNNEIYGLRVRLLFLSWLYIIFWFLGIIIVTGLGTIRGQVSNFYELYVYLRVKTQPARENVHLINRMFDVMKNQRAWPVLRAYAIENLSRLSPPKETLHLFFTLLRDTSTPSIVTSATWDAVYMLNSRMTRENRAKGYSSAGDDVLALLDILSEECIFYSSLQDAYKVASNKYPQNQEILIEAAEYFNDTDSSTSMLRNIDEKRLSSVQQKRIKELKSKLEERIR